MPSYVLINLVVLVAILEADLGRRKVSRFRATYGAHPDEYVFPWIELDLNAAWSDQISRRIQRARTGGLFS